VITATAVEDLGNEVKKAFKLLLLLAVVALVSASATYRLTRPRPVPPAPPPLARAAVEYVGSLPATFKAAADQVAAGKITDRDGLIGALQAHAKPLADQLKSTFDPLCDAGGKFTNRAAAADVLTKTARALGGK
jgi:hypothetical protein